MGDPLSVHQTVDLPSEVGKSLRFNNIDRRVKHQRQLPVSGDIFACGLDTPGEGMTKIAAMHGLANLPARCWLLPFGGGLCGVPVAKAVLFGNRFEGSGVA